MSKQATNSEFFQLQSGQTGCDATATQAGCGNVCSQTGCTPADCEWWISDELC